MVNKLNNTLIKGTDILEKLEIPFFLVGGTLLGIVREQSLLAHDGDVDVAVLVEDLTDEVVEKIKAVPEFENISECKEKYGEINFAFERHFDIFPLYKRGKYRYYNAIGDECLVWPSHLFDDKRRKVEYMGRKFTIPQPPEQFLKTMYGNWKGEDKEFNWRQGLNYKLYDKF